MRWAEVTITGLHYDGCGCVPLQWGMESVHATSGRTDAQCELVLLWKVGSVKDSVFIYAILRFRCAKQLLDKPAVQCMLEKMEESIPEADKFDECIHKQMTGEIGCSSNGSTESSDDDQSTEASSPSDQSTTSSYTWCVTWCVHVRIKFYACG